MTDCKANDNLTIESDYSGSLASETQERLWTNYDNSDFYEKIHANEMEGIAIKKGLVHGCDIKKLKPYWAKANAILEVGAGYGRVIKHLLKNGFQGNLTAIERSSTLFTHLVKEFGNNKNISLRHMDIHDTNNINPKVDIVLFLWSGIADFSPAEQYQIIKSLSSSLNPGGKLILDTVPNENTPLGMEKSKIQQVYKLNFKGNVIYTYSMSLTEIDSHAKQAGFTKVEHIHYKTDIGYSRIFHILHQPTD